MYPKHWGIQVCKNTWKVLVIVYNANYKCRKFRMRTFSSLCIPAKNYIAYLYVSNLEGLLMYN